MAPEARKEMREVTLKRLEYQWPPLRSAEGALAAVTRAVREAESG